MFQIKFKNIKSFFLFSNSVKKFVSGCCGDEDYCILLWKLLKFERGGIDMKEFEQKKVDAEESIGVQEENTDGCVEEPKRKVSKTWEAVLRLRGSVVILDPTLYDI